MTLASDIRRKALKGPALWCTLAFFAVLAASTLLAIASTLYAISWLATLSVFGWESHNVASTRPDDYARWIAEAARRWSAVRGDALPPLSQWISLAAVAVLLFAIGYSGFSRRSGYSLTVNDELTNTPGRVRRILEEFGYFKDILADDDGKDIMAARRKIVFPSGMVKNLTNDKPPSVAEEATLRFFMAHEYAHTLTLDNAAHSLFRLVFWVTTALTSALLLIFIVPSVMISAPYFGNALVFLFLCATVIVAILYCLAASMRNVIFSYLKTREYFADAAGFDRLPAEIDPYRFKRDGPTSAWDRSTSKLERDLHRQGISLNARNMLPALLVLFVSLRSLYILISPAHGEWPVLAFDGVFLAAFILLAWNLPPTLPNPAGRPLLPWLAALLAILALFLSVPGLLGLLVYFYEAPVVAETTGILLAWPTLFAAAVCGGVCLRLGWVRLFKDGEKGRRKNRIFSRARFRPVLLALMAVPGRFFSALSLILLLGLGTMQLNSALDGVIQLGLSTDARLPGGNLIVAALLLALACLVYRNLLFFRPWLLLAEVVLTTFPMGAMVIAMVMVVGAPSRSAVRAEDGIPDIAPLLTNPPPELLATAFGAAMVFVLVYIIAKTLEYFSRKFDRARRVQGDFYG